MTAPTFVQVVEGIDARLATIAELNHFPYPPASPPFPCAFPVTPPINYRETYRSGVITLRFDIVVMEGTSAGHEQQLQLYEFLDWAGDRSVFQAFDADPTLGLGDKVDAKIVGESRPLGLEEIAAYEAFGASLPLLVAITNT